MDYFKIPVEDQPDESIEEYLEHACNFIGYFSFKRRLLLILMHSSHKLHLFSDTNIKNRKQPCLVFSNLGISRAAAIIIAYLVYSERIPVEVIYLIL